MIGHKLVPYKVTHKRFFPKEYCFTHSFFWFKIDLSNTSSWPTKFFSFNKFNLYSFFDTDHIKLGLNTAKENYLRFARSNGMTNDVKSIYLYTQVRFLGHVFNPVSFVIIESTDNKKYGIIEIGNTFNEQKPYFVSDECFHKAGFNFSTKKYFYISPFLAHDNELNFSFNRSGEELNIFVDDKEGEKTLLKVWFYAKEKKATTFELLKLTFIFPFVSLKAIFLIHWHAFVLWVMGIPYFKKEEKKNLQKGALKWKISKIK